MTLTYFVQPFSKDQEGIQSHVKFGSMDSVGVKNRDQLKAIRTARIDTWDLKSNKFVMGLEK